MLLSSRVSRQDFLDWVSIFLWYLSYDHQKVQTVVKLTVSSSIKLLVQFYIFEVQSRWWSAADPHSLWFLRRVWTWKWKFLENKLQRRQRPEDAIMQISDKLRSEFHGKAIPRVQINGHTDSAFPYIPEFGFDRIMEELLKNSFRHDETLLLILTSL